MRRAVPLALCAVLLVQAAWFQSQKSITYDETVYLGSALQTVWDGEPDPRLVAKGVAPLPVLLAYGLPAWWAGGQDRPLAWQGQLGDPPLVHQARQIHSVIVGCGLLVVVYLWLAARRGVWAAATGCGLLALSPTIVAHTALATTDALAALTILLALAALAWFDRRPGYAPLLAVAGAIAAAVSAKYSGPFLLLVATPWLARPYARAAREGEGTSSLPLLAGSSPRGYIAGWLATCALLVALVAPATWALHGFALTEIATARSGGDSAPVVHLPAPLAGILAQVRHQRHGHPTYLLGERSTEGWIHYLPFALLVKSTPAELLLVAAAVCVAFVSMRRRRAGDGGEGGPGVDSFSRQPRCAAPRSTRVLWLLTLGVYLAFALSSRVQIGHRYILVAYPLVALWAVDVLADSRGPLSRWPAWTAGALLGLQLSSALAIGPHYLAYFNAFSGGPERADRLLVQSNLDWGQDLILLRRELERLGSQCVLLDYHGTADPAAYGLSYLDARRPQQPEAIAQCEYLAVSVTALREVVRAQPLYALLRDVEPIGRAGYSIRIWDMATVRALRESARSGEPDRMDERDERDERDESAEGRI